MYRLTVSQALLLIERYDTVADIAMAIEEEQIVISAQPDLLPVRRTSADTASPYSLGQTEPIIGVLDTLAFRIKELGREDAGVAHECEMIASSVLGLRTDLADVFYEMKTGSGVIAKAINDQTVRIVDQTHRIEQVILQNEARLDGLEARALVQRTVS
jgi:hypothetical protein